MRLRLETEELGREACAISLTGELDLYTSPEFKQELVRVVSGKARHVVVDLSETTFIDSTALGVLLRGVERLREKGGRLLVVCPDENIRRVFEVTGLDRVFLLYDRRSEALASVTA